MDENEISKVIVDAAIEVHRELGGPGLLESVYEEALAFELKQRGLSVDRQRRVPIVYKGQRLAGDLRLDLIVNQKVVVECKAATMNSLVRNGAFYGFKIIGLVYGYWSILMLLICVGYPLLILFQPMSIDRIFLNVILFLLVGMVGITIAMEDYHAIKKITKPDMKQFFRELFIAHFFVLASPLIMVIVLVGGGFLFIVGLSMALYGEDLYSPEARESNSCPQDGSPCRYYHVL